MSSSIALRPRFQSTSNSIGRDVENGHAYRRHRFVLTMPPWSMISPASRGIGFALARRVLQTTNAPVVATARRDIDKTREELLQGLGVDEARLRVLRLDVTGMLIGTLRLYIRACQTHGQRRNAEILSRRVNYRGRRGRMQRAVQAWKSPAPTCILRARIAIP